MARKVTELTSARLFGKFDWRINRLIHHLFEIGELDDTTDRAFGESIGRSKETIWKWRSYRSFPNAVSLILIHKRWNIDIHWLCGLRGQMLKDAFVKKERKLKLVA
jgi:hypothetical protein